MVSTFYFLIIIESVRICTPSEAYSGIFRPVSIKREVFQYSLETPVKLTFYNGLKWWRLAESNHGHMDFQYYVVPYLSVTYGDQ